MEKIDSSSRTAEGRRGKMPNPPSKPDIGNLADCITDCKRATLSSDTGPEDPNDFNELRGRLESCREKLPPLYRELVYKPFVDELDNQGKDNFNKILLSDPDKEGEAGLMLDIAQAILQNGEGYNEKATDAYQEVISDLYDGFLSAEDRSGVKPPDYGVTPPLAKWGRPDFGPYTWTADATATFDVGTAIVNMPPPFASQALLAWAALAHETAGHDILSADEGLTPELAKAVRMALNDADVGDVLPSYWADRIDETAADVMGILNMGPIVGIALIALLRGMNAAYTRKARLRSWGTLDDPHPADVLRGYLAASVIRLLSFNGAEDWAKIIEAETDKDVTTIRAGWIVIEPEVAKKSAEVVAGILVRGKMEKLESHSLGEIQNWHNDDDAIVAVLRPLLTTVGKLPEQYAKGIYAAHVVAAATLEALSKNADIPQIFDRMIAVLKIMHDTNPSWGPLYVAHPGNLVSYRSYIPHEED
jgi:hypothetical protein